MRFRADGHTGTRAGGRGVAAAQHGRVRCRCPPAAALRAGFGRIESILAVPSPAAGPTASNPSRRIGMRMDDGSVQHFDTQATGMAVGDRIEITANGTMRHPA